MSKVSEQISVECSVPDKIIITHTLSQDRKDHEGGRSKTERARGQGGLMQRKDHYMNLTAAVVVCRGPAQDQANSPAWRERESFEVTHG